MTSQGLSEIELGGIVLVCFLDLTVRGDSRYAIIVVPVSRKGMPLRLCITCYHTEFPTANTARSNKGTQETDGR